MDPEKYLDRMLAKYASSFDITKNFQAGDLAAAAYGYYFSLNEKYVLTPKANLWSVRTYEHILFLIEDTCTASLLEKIHQVMTDYMDPVLVRRGEKYPEKDHMSTALTAAVICRNTPDQQTIRKIRSFRFDKGYMLSLRGHSEGHLIVACMDSEKVFVNRLAEKEKKIYENAFDEIRRGKKGYHELFEDDLSDKLP